MIETINASESWRRFKEKTRKINKMGNEDVGPNIKDKIVEFVTGNLNNKESDWGDKMEGFIKKYGFDRVYQAYKKGVDSGELSKGGLKNLKEKKYE